jgi:hypothetical protein
VIPLGSLHDPFTGLTPDAARIAYAESLAAVEDLTAHLGKSAIKSILDLMAQNYNFENAYKTALHRTVSQYEAEWERGLTR